MIALKAALLTLSYLGVVLLVGVTAFWLYLWPEGRWTRVITILAWAGWAASVVAAAGLVWVQAHLSGHGVLDSVATLAGTALLLRLAVLCVAWSWLHEVRATYGSADYRAMSGPKSFAGALVLLVIPATLVMNSRSVTGTWAPAKTVLATLHVAAMTIWLGGLLVITAILLPRGDPDEIRRALPRFSLVATICIGTSVVSGVLLAIAQADGVHPVLRSTYGAVLLAKVIVLAVIVTLGNMSRSGVRRRLDGQVGADGRVRAIQGAVIAEFALALVLLSLAATLSVTRV